MSHIVGIVIRKDLIGEYSNLVRNNRIEHVVPLDQLLAGYNSLNLESNEWS